MMASFWGASLCVMYGNEEGAGRNAERGHMSGQSGLSIKRSRG